MANHSFTLIWPGLAPVLIQTVNNTLLPPGLTAIIRQGRFNADSSRFLRVLLNQFSDTLIESSDLPVASLYTKSRHTILMTPCHLHPDRDQLRLFADNLAISKQEMTDLITAITPLLNEHGLVLHDIVGDNWIIQADFSPAVTFTALEDVPRKGIQASLPVGKEQKQWRRLLNEIQMELHNHPVNQQRTQQGKLTINSVWFWGQGQYDGTDNKWQQITGRHPLLTQLATQTACHHQQTPHNVRSLLTGKQLYLIDELDLSADWQTQLRQIDQLLLQTTRQYLRTGRLHTLRLYIPDYGCYKVTPIDCWKFWKIQR